MFVAVVLGSAGGFGTRALAQEAPRLRADVLMAEELTEEIRQSIAMYVTHWAGQLQSEDAQRVAEARRRLLEPVRGGRVSEAFTGHYSEQAGAELRPALDSDQLVVRLNAIIVVTRLSGEAALPLIEQGMTDDSPAVRYWAIKAVQTVEFADQDKSTLVERVVAHLERESEPSVAEQTMVALVDIDLPEARTRGLEVLNARIARHLNEPGRSMQVEHAGLSRVYQQLARTGDPDRPALRQLARAAVRYQDLAARYLQAEGVEEEARESYIRMIELCNAVLRFTADNLNAAGVPGRIEPIVAQGNWGGVEQNADEWRALMLRPPYGLTEQDLAVAGE
ncbi:MAG: hypothetical protein WD534_04800 [Phycisphaeraceae bacterium]